MAIEPKDELIQVRVARDEKRRLQDLAKKRGQTLSDFLRQSATNEERRAA